MTTPTTVNPSDPNKPAPSAFKLLGAGTYDLVNINPTGAKACAIKIVSPSGDAGWTLTDYYGVATGPQPVGAQTTHIGQTQAITCASPVLVYW